MAPSPHPRHRTHRRAQNQRTLAWPVTAFAVATALAVSYVAYVLWPNWPDSPASLDAPTIPITVGDQTFNIEPAAIRQSAQRRPGAQERIDLAYLWPSLTPPDPAERPSANKPTSTDRLFVTILHDDGTLPPPERFQSIYPRYLSETRLEGPEGLTVRSFRDGTPYQNEDLVNDAEAPDHFNARCTRTGVGNSGICLYDRRIGEANITVRFPRDWLSDWPTTVRAIERLLARLSSASPGEGQGGAK